MMALRYTEPQRRLLVRLLPAPESAPVGNAIRSVRLTQAGTVAAKAVAANAAVFGQLPPPTADSPATYAMACCYAVGAAFAKARTYVCFVVPGAPRSEKPSFPGVGATERQALPAACYWENQRAWVRVARVGRAPRTAIRNARRYVDTPYAQAEEARRARENASRYRVLADGRRLSEHSTLAAARRAAQKALDNGSFHVPVIYMEV